MISGAAVAVPGAASPPGLGRCRLCGPERGGGGGVGGTAVLDVNTGLFFKASEGELRRARSAKSAARWGEVRWERGEGLVRGVPGPSGAAGEPRSRGCGRASLLPRRSQVLL